MSLQDELRMQLIKQFAADVVENVSQDGSVYYACPSCRRPVAKSKDRCGSCEQMLNWDNIVRVEQERSGSKTATLSFEVSGDFVKEDCRKCPLSYITKREGENVYECPLNMRGKCPLEIRVK